ncbi:hypothetical protein [Streptomyces tubercidicus]
MATGRSVPVSRSSDPAGWELAAYANVPLVTQWDDGAHTGSEPGAVVAGRARGALLRAGLHPETVHGDGGDGWPGGAPYDRVIVTAGVRTVPPCWWEQSRPGGVILAPWGTHYSDQDALVRLTVREDGSASGRSCPGRGHEAAVSVLGRGPLQGAPVAADGQRAWLAALADSWAACAPCTGLGTRRSTTTVRRPGHLTDQS